MILFSRKNNQEVSNLNDAFLKNGFRRVASNKIKINVTIDDDTYMFGPVSRFSTNKMRGSAS